MHLEHAHSMPKSDESPKEVEGASDDREPKRAPRAQAEVASRDLVAQAIEAVESSAVKAKLTAVARAAWVDREGPAPAPRSEIAEKARDLELQEAEATTSLGNALSVLERLPEDAAERALASVLVTMALRDAWAEEDSSGPRLAARAVTLSARTQLDVLGVADRVMGDDAVRLWKEVPGLVRGASLTRGESALACAAIAASTSTAATKARQAIATDDALLARILSAADGAQADAESRFSGELVPAPRGPVATTLLALTGLLLVVHLGRLLLRLALAYRAEANVRVSRAGVVVSSKSTLLGRTLRERETRVARDSLAQATREVRYPRFGLYAGLLALAIGSYVGVGALGDGVKSASPTLLVTGLAIVSAGVVLDLLLTSASPSARGRCRVLFVASRGPAMCIGNVDQKRADEALAMLKA